MPNPRRVLLGLLILFVSVPMLAQAQPDAAAKQRSLELFTESDAHYKRGEFEQAAELLREAYALYPEPLLLYNLARALEGMGDTAGAIAQYQQYLASATDIDDRGAIERRVATLQASLPAATAEPAGGAGITSPPIEGSAPVDAPAASRRPSRLPWITGGAGLALVGAGAIFGGLASSKHDAAIDEPIQADAASLQASAERHATTANVLFVAGGAVVIGSVIWGVIDRKRAHGRATPASARLVISPTTIGVAWELR